MAKSIPIGPQNILRVTLMAAVGAFALRTLADATGVGKGLTRFLP